MTKYFALLYFTSYFLQVHSSVVHITGRFNSSESATLKRKKMSRISWYPTFVINAQI